jgi:hypothetical protein
MENHAHQFIDHNQITSHYVDGEAASIGIKGLFGSKSFFDKAGNLICHTEYNPLGGKTVFNAFDLNHVYKSTHTCDGNIKIYQPGDVGLHITHKNNATIGDSNGNTQFISHDLGQGFYSVMSFSDPLLHLSDYEIPELYFNE